AGVLLRARARDSDAAMDRVRRGLLQGEDHRSEGADDHAGARLHFPDLVPLMTRRIIREPLCHFVLLGAALFAVYGLVATPAVDNAEIVVTSDRIASLTAQFSAARGGRPPTDVELRGMIDAYVRDEMLYREGLALGLDRDDPVVRNRIRQKVDVLSSDALSI